MKRKDGQLMILRIVNKAIVSVLLVLTLCVVSGGLIHTFSDQSHTSHTAKAYEDEEGKRIKRKLKR